MFANRTHLVWTAAVLPVLLGVAPLAATPDPAPRLTPLLASQTTPAKRVAPTGFPPRAYFNRACADCHGKDGAAFPRSFFNRSDRVLRSFTREMVDGHATVSTASANLPALVALQRSMQRREPFVAWIARDTLETSPGVTLSIAPAGKVTRVPRTDWNWRITGADPARSIITARRGNKTVTLRLAESPFSHQR